MNILNEIALRAKERTYEKKRTMPIEKIIYMAGQSNDKRDFPFEKALKGKDISFICEIKKASPSKGIIAKEFPYLEIAKEYEAAGAGAISVLTEPFYFKGHDVYLREIADAVSVPILRKDFTIDSYMIYEAKLLGASAILLICAILEDDQLSEYIEIAHGLGLSALVETHNEREVEMALNAGARIVGVNNRDLRTFEVDVSTSERLRPLIPKDKIFVSESGIREPWDIARLRQIHANAALIGERLMRSRDKAAELNRLRGGAFDEN